MSSPPASIRRKATFSVTDRVRSVPALAAGTESAGTVSVKVPNSMPTGSYFLLACVDDRNSVAESDEANNCVASATRITVTK